MLDIHSHLLPDIDDGSDSVKLTEKNLELLISAGIKGVAFTPHYYPAHSGIEHFLKKREKAFDKIKNISQISSLKTTLGAEVYLSYTLFNFEDISPLCYKGTNTILIEPALEEKFSSETESKLTKLVSDYPIVPIIAHIDRFPAIIGDLGVLSYLRELGFLFQVNADSLNSFSKRRLVYRAIKHGYCDFFGNDIHKTGFEPSVFQEKMKTLEKKFGTEFIRYIDSNSEKYIFK